MTRPATIIAAGLALLVAAPADAAPCRPKGSETIVASSYARLYFGRSGGAYACVIRTGRRFKLRDDDQRLEGPGSDSGPPQLVGKHAAYVVTEDIPATAFFRTLTVIDLKSGRREAVYEGNDDLGWGPGPFRLFYDGAVAWAGRAQTTPGTFDTVSEIWRYRPGAGETRLDSGPDVRTESFAVSADRTRIFWMNGDEPRSATVR
jgi:hypothetical protein